MQQVHDRLTVVPAAEMPLDLSWRAQRNNPQLIDHGSKDCF